ncbi:MAG: hypothetical protein GEV08_06245 [Acidimicrobiia bacterium]|nr:hypothetical protein [Acidimicrobiia bacterium]
MTDAPRDAAFQLVLAYTHAQGQHPDPYRRGILEGACKATDALLGCNTYEQLRWCIELHGEPPALLGGAWHPWAERVTADLAAGLKRQQGQS